MAAKTDKRAPIEGSFQDLTQRGAAAGIADLMAEADIWRKSLSPPRLDTACRARE
jgi:hypothetical protein